MRVYLKNLTRSVSQARDCNMTKDEGISEDLKDGWLDNPRNTKTTLGLEHVRSPLLRICGSTKQKTFWGLLRRIERARLERLQPRISDFLVCPSQESSCNHSVKFWYKDSRIMYFHVFRSEAVDKN